MSAIATSPSLTLCGTADDHDPRLNIIISLDSIHLFQEYALPTFHAFSITLLWPKFTPTNLSLTHAQGIQYYRATIAAGLELFQKGGLLLPLTLRHGIYGTWMQCPASLGQTTRYQICISGCRSSSIRYQRLHSPSPIMGSPSLAEPSTSLKHTYCVFHGRIM